MRCSASWLSEYVNLTVSAQELADRLSLVGIETVAEPRFEERPQGVVAGKIIGVEPHPRADRLSVCLVDAGGKELTVVCGAPNVRPGLVSALALPGAILKNGLKIKKAALRGVESHGMLLAEDELGLSEDHTGIMELDENVAPGTPLEEIIDFDDWILEADLTPNRIDCASVVGLAREAAAILGQKMSIPPLGYSQSGRPITELAEVVIHDPDLCPRYAASLVSGLSVGRSPWWIRERLISGGVRPINNLVDVTNYILLEMNQPLHAFDFDRLAGGRIEVRRAAAGERFVTLDGQERVLNEDMLMICDAERPVAVAGVMGGLNSEVEDDTTRVLLEAAYFEPTSIRRTSTQLGLATEASYRFERGIDPVNVTAALERATALLARLGGGRIHPGLIDEHPAPITPPTLTLRVERCNDVLGSDLDGREMARLLNSIEVKAELDEDGRTLTVRAPSWRQDLTREIDLVEEVARLHGFENIPAAFPPMTEAAAATPPLEALRIKISPALAAAGLHQVVTYSFIPAETAKLMGWSEDDPRYDHVAMLNPITEDQSVLRTSLLYGLITTLETNLRHRTEAVRLFEWGVVFFPQKTGELPREECRLAGLIAGLREPVGWTGTGQKVDLWDVKGLVEYVIRILGPHELVFEPTTAPEYLDGTAARVLAGGLDLGRLGRLDPELLRAFDVKEPAFAFDLDAEALNRLAELPRPTFRPLPRYPSITRDLALVVDKSIAAGSIIGWAKEVDDPLIKETIIFDVYEGKPLEDSQKSIGLRVRYLSDEKTLTEEEIAPLHHKLTQHLLKRTGGKLRT